MADGLSIGVDLGSTTSKAVLLDASGREMARALHRSGRDARAMALRLREELLDRAGQTGAGIRTAATGYGRTQCPYADRAITEITCHARGAVRLHPTVRTLIDIGGQDSKAIRLGEGGEILDFTMNDRCAAGTGAFLDFVADRFGMSMAELSALPPAGPGAPEISATCVVFAETELVGLVSGGRALEDVLAGVHRSVAQRAAQMVHRVGIQAPVYFSGGVALNEAMRRELEAALGTQVLRCRDAQFTAALGAAMLAREGVAGT